jgi:hypothetical protein
MKTRDGVSPSRVSREYLHPAWVSPESVPVHVGSFSVRSLHGLPSNRVCFYSHIAHNLPLCCHIWLFASIGAVSAKRLSNSKLGRCPSYVQHRTGVKANQRLTHSTGLTRCFSAWNGAISGPCGFANPISLHPVGLGIERVGLRVNEDRVYCWRQSLRMNEFEDVEKIDLLYLSWAPPT